MNLANMDLLSAGVNFYYALYHCCSSLISSTSTEIPIDKCVAEWKMRAQLPRIYVHLQHKQAVSLTRKMDAKLADKLDELCKVREYLSYGPNILYESDAKGGLERIQVFTCKFNNLPKKIEDFSSELPALINRCCKLLKARLNKSLFSFFMFESYVVTDILCKDMRLRQDFIDECWSITDSFDKEGKYRKMALKALAL
jgi:hypothetical protein